MSLRGFRGQKQREARYSQGRRKGGKRAYWSKDFRVPHQSQNRKGVACLVIPGWYEDPRPPDPQNPDADPMIPYWPFIEHRVSIPKPEYRFKGSFLCTGGWNQNKLDPCCAEHAISAGLPKNVNISMAVRFAIGIIVLEFFHLVPLKNKDGSSKTYQRGDRKGEQMMSKEICTGRGCELCKENIERSFAAKRYMNIGSNFRENLEQIDINVSQTCYCGGALDVIGYACPECGAIVLDPEKSGLSDEEIGEIIEKPFGSCPKCGTKSFYAKEVLACDSCDDPIPLSLLHEKGTIPAVVWLCRVGEGTNTSLAAVKVRAATQFTVPTDEKDLLDIEEASGGDVLHWHKDIRDLMEPFKFPEMLSASPDPQTLNQQAETIRQAIPEYRNPYSGNDAVKEYGKRGPDDDVATSEADYD